MRRWVLYQEERNGSYWLRPLETERLKRTKDITTFEAESLWSAMQIKKRYLIENGLDK